MSAEHEPSIQRAKYISELVFLSKPLIQAALASYQKKKLQKPLQVGGTLETQTKAVRSLVGHKTLVKAHLPCWSRSLALGLKNKEPAGAPESEPPSGSAGGEAFPLPAK